MASHRVAPEQALDPVFILARQEIFRNMHFATEHNLAELSRLHSGESSQKCDGIVVKVDESRLEEIFTPAENV